MVRVMTVRLPIALAMRMLLVACIGLALAGCQRALPKPAWEILMDEFGTEDVVFVAMPSLGQPLMVHDVKRAAERFPPCSTFKIWNTLIGLDTGVISGPDFALTWNPQRDPPLEYWPESWKRDHNLTSAFRNSVFWFYQEVARRVGSVRMERYLKSLEYGNADISGGIDHFWLESTLRISPTEQTQLIERLLSGKTPFKPDHVEIVRTLMKQDGGHGFALFAKTGLGHLAGSDGYEGWFVGWVESGGRTSPFALYMRSNEFDDILHARKSNALRGLRALGLIP